MSEHESIPRPAQDPQRIALTDSMLAAAQCVQAVTAGQSLSECLARSDPALRPSAQAISFHVMRRLGFARAARSQLVKRVPADPLLDAVLLVSLTLLETALHAAQTDDKQSLRGAPVYAVHTVVDQAVNTARRTLKPYRGLINGTLRNYIRQRDVIAAVLRKNAEAVWNYPSWWIDKIRQAYPQQWEAILQAGNTPAPLIVRVNGRRATPDQVLDAFGQAGIRATLLEHNAVLVRDPAPVQRLPGFYEGTWSVQDISAQRAGTLLPLQNGMRVLDACAAPGGKTAHMLEQADIELVALDSDPDRLVRVQQNLERLGLDGPKVRLCGADASDLSAWWDGQLFDAILADVPCTGSGVVQRHPDIRWLRRKTDIAKTVDVQRRIMDALWKTLAPGGHLLFVTCSIFPDEGEKQADAFSLRHHDARRLPAPGQVLPLQQNDGLGGDGFFYSLFTKAAQALHDSD